MFKKLFKIFISKKILLVIAIAAVAIGTFFYYKSNIVSKQQVDEEQKTENNLDTIITDLTPGIVTQETKDLGQSPQNEIEAAEAVIENFAML
jgi:flagellar basal body-associated protein FliL